MQSLFLTDVTVPWGSTRLVNLCNLSLGSHIGCYKLSLSQLIRLVSSSQRLEELRIGDMELMVSAEDEKLPAENFNLPNHVSLELSEMSWESFTRILSRVQFPLTCCKELHLEQVDMYQAGLGRKESFDFLGQGFIQQIRSLVKFNGPPELSFINDDIACLSTMPSCSGTPKRGLHLALDSSGENSTRMGQIVAKALPDEPLTLKSHVYVDFPLNALSQFPSIAKVALYKSYGVQNGRPHFLQYLAQRHTNPSSGVEEWPCPRLKGLDLRRLADIHPRRYESW